jgi:hypothetical protein
MATGFASSRRSCRGRPLTARRERSGDAGEIGIDDEGTDSREQRYEQHRVEVVSAPILEAAADRAAVAAGREIRWCAALARLLGGPPSGLVRAPQTTRRHGTEHEQPERSAGIRRAAPA